jgi:hypothetical protein
MAAALFMAAPLCGQTILVAVQESLAGKPLSAPLPVAEGLSASLFEAGYIVFELPGPLQGPAQTQHRQLALQGGAELILEVTAEDSADTSGAFPLFVSRIGFTLIDASTGRVKAKGVEELSNKGRENTVDSKSLAGEAGRLVASRVGLALKDGTGVR